MKAKNEIPGMMAGGVWLAALLIVAMGAVGYGFGRVQATASAGEPGGGTITRAIAVLASTEGHSVRGTVTFSAEGGKGVRVQGRIENLAPGKHGFHVHEFGDLSAKDGKSAGAHFAPRGHRHGGPGEKGTHAGDFGNIEADANGVATIDFVDDDLELTGDGSIIGRSVVVHADPDDLVSQPSGNAGARVAVGVIGIAAPPASGGGGQ